jgi:hypothetical protein
VANADVRADRWQKPLALDLPLASHIRPPFNAAICCSRMSVSASPLTYLGCLTVRSLCICSALSKYPLPCRTQTPGTLRRASLALVWRPRARPMRAGPIRMLAGLHPFALNPASWGGMVSHGLASKRLRADWERACCSVPTRVHFARSRRGFQITSPPRSLECWDRNARSGALLYRQRGERPCKVATRCWTIFSLKF